MEELVIIMKSSKLTPIFPGRCFFQARIPGITLCPQHSLGSCTLGPTVSFEKNYANKWLKNEGLFSSLYKKKHRKTKNDQTWHFLILWYMNSFAPQTLGCSNQKSFLTCHGKNISGCFQKIRVFHYRPSILGYPYSWKHPYHFRYSLYNLWFPCH